MIKFSDFDKYVELHNNCQNLTSENTISPTDSTCLVAIINPAPIDY